MSTIMLLSHKYSCPNCDIWGSGSGIANGSYLPACDAMSSGEYCPTFRRIILPLASSVKQSKKNILRWTRFFLWKHPQCITLIRSVASQQTTSSTWTACEFLHYNT